MDSKQKEMIQYVLDGNYTPIEYNANPSNGIGLVPEMSLEETARAIIENAWYSSRNSKFFYFRPDGSIEKSTFTNIEFCLYEDNICGKVFPSNEENKPYFIRMGLL